MPQGKETYLGPTPSSLRAVAAWNANKGMDLLKWETHEKNHEKATTMQKDAGRHLRTADNCERAAWMLEHKRKK